VAAVAVLLAAAAPAAAQNPEPSGEHQVWLSTLTPVNSEKSGTVYTGCDNEGRGRGVGHARCSGPGHNWLSRNSFDLGGETYTFITIAANSSGDLTVKLDKQIPSELLVNIALEIKPYVAPIDSLTSPNIRFTPGYKEPDANRLVTSNATTTDWSDGSQSLVWGTTISDWKVAISGSVRYENGRTEHYGSPSVWGVVTMRLTYAGALPPDLGTAQPESPTDYVVPGYNPPPQGQGGGDGDTGNQQQPEPVDVTPPEQEDSGQQQQGGRTAPDGQDQPEQQGEASGDGVAAPTQQGDNGSPELTDPAPPQRPALQGAAADYDADGDGRISSDEYGAAAADYGKTKLSVEEILQIRQGYIDSHE
jgi:hypothetical protein